MIELGGEQDSIHDTEEIRDQLLRVAFGVWDHIKNHGDHDADNWVLEWVGFLPGQRIPPGWWSSIGQPP